MFARRVSIHLKPKRTAELTETYEVTNSTFPKLPAVAAAPEPVGHP
jgi:hypothetical protein